LKAKPPKAKKFFPFSKPSPFSSMTDGTGSQHTRKPSTTNIVDKTAKRNQPGQDEGNKLRQDLNPIGNNHALVDLFGC
jgi:hypothetical protein